MKKYSVNVHYDAIIEVYVLAKSEEEAIRLAENEAAHMPRDRMWFPNGPENSCVTESVELDMSFAEAKGKAFEIMKKADDEDIYFCLEETFTLPRRIWDGDDYVSVSCCSNACSWNSEYDTIMMYCGEGYEEFDISELLAALQYDIFICIIKSAASNDIEL